MMSQNLDEENSAEDDPHDAFSQLCAVNGIKEEDLKHPERITQIEMVLDDYCCMRTLRHFTHLQSLCLIQQAISKIEGLDSCYSLQRLLLNENNIKVIEGLGSCRRLKQLYLCSNAIESLGSGLVGLDDLEMLWVAENRLSSLDGLNAVPQLKEVNAARNMITSIVGAFEGVRQLRCLNLADNRICSFREVLYLSSLTGLEDLSFADPDWGENPICLLCNYGTFVLHHLPCLQLHDRIRLSQEDRQRAEAAFNKKALFYNMRTKLVRRQAAAGLRHACSQREELRLALTSAASEAGGVCKRLEADRVAGVESSASGGEEVRSRWRAIQELADGAGVLWEALEEAVESEREAAVEGLRLELWTGGNVRRELGLPGREDWADRIAELVRSRFRAQDFASLGVQGLKVERVVRVHNRSLRIACDELLDRLELEVHQQFEYLFYVPRPEAASSEIRGVIEEGLLLPSRCSAPSHCAKESSSEPGSSWGRRQHQPTLLTNSVAVSEVPRLRWQVSTRAGQAFTQATQLARQQHSSGGFGTAPAAAVSHGTLLVCGAYICNPEPGNPESFEMPALGGIRSAWAQDSAGDSGGDLSSIFRFRTDDPSQRVWEPSRPDLVLPEYLVEFEYLYDRAPSGTQEEAQEDVEFGLFGGLVQDYSLYVQLATQALKLPLAGDEEGSAPPAATVSVLPQVERLDLDSLVHPEHGVLKTAVPDALGTLQVLNSHGRGLQRIEAAVFQSLPALQTLILSCNCLKSLGSLSCPALTRLDVSFNLLEALSLSSLPSLQNLDVSWNSLLSRDVLSGICEEVPGLLALTIQGNPVAMDPHSRTLVLARLKELRWIDEQQVVKTEAEEAREKDRGTTVLTETMLREHSSCSSTSPGLGGCCAAPTAPVASAASLSADWKAVTESVHLQALGLESLCSLTGLPRLRFLQLSSNQLASLEPLAACSQLEELYVEQNRLSSLKGLANLVKLKRLDAGGNRISDVLELQQLPQLAQLSLEDNHVDALDTFARLQSLAELYLSNNLLEDVRSVLLLKQLPKLLILDLAGNELRSATEYREYTIFHLRRLKVLDGLPITQADHQGADEKFSGKVTMELLEEKLGPSSPCYTLRVVDLSNQSIRELGSLINDEIFPCLRELTLDGNPFASISNLGPLSKLTVLRMNRSRIDLEKGLLPTSGQEPRGATALPQLQVLEMGYCGISDLAPLAQVPLPNLRILHLPGNEIARVEGLSGFEQLRELVLDKNRIRQFEEQSFAGLKSLRELRLEDNALKSLSNLGPLPRLRALYLSFNRVAELAELEKLRNLKHVLLLNMASNPVARKPLFRAHIVHALGSVRAIDGREVTMDEREKVAQLLQVTDPTKQTGSMLYYMEQQPAAVTGVAPQPGQPLLPGPGLLGPQPEIVSEGAPRRQAEPGDAHRRGPTARSHSVPRHMSLEHRIGQLPPGSGR